MRLRFALALLLALPATARADEPQAVDCTNARVLISPGYPPGLVPFLPCAHPLESTTWPIPSGPVLVLGLPRTDPAARRIGEAFGMLTPATDLHGGYVVKAWRDGERPIAVILADDAAALYAARFELETALPTGKEKDPRSVDFGQPDEQAAFHVAPGTKTVRPRYRIRALDPLGVPEDDGISVAGARGNRLWLDVDKIPAERMGPIVRLCRHFGVVPVAKAAASGSALKGLVEAQRTYGIRHFALSFEGSDASNETEFARGVVEALRQGGLDEIVVVPFALAIQLEGGIWGLPPPFLQRIPEAKIAWSGPLEHSTSITREAAAKWVHNVGVPMLLYENWGDTFREGDPAPRIPTSPRGRAHDLGDVLEGIVIVGSEGAEDMLEGAWSEPQVAPVDHVAEFAAALPADVSDPATFLRGGAKSLRDLHVLSAQPPWMLRLAASLEGLADSLPPRDRVVVVPVLSEPVQADGSLDEPAWSRAATIPLGVVDMRLLVFSTGRELVFGLRLGPACPPHQVGLTLDSDRSIDAGFDYGPSGVDHGMAFMDGHATGATRRQRGTRTAEVVFDTFALGGDPYPTRAFGIEIVLRHHGESVQVPVNLLLVGR